MKGHLIQKSVKYLLPFLTLASITVFSQEQQEREVQCQTIKGKKRCIEYVFDKNSSGTIVYLYNDKEQLERKIESTFGVDGDSTGFEVVYIYDKLNRPVRKGVTTYFYDKDGRLVKIVSKFPSGKAQYDYEYEQNGRFWKGTFLSVNKNYEICYFDPLSPQNGIIVPDGTTGDFTEAFIPNRVDSIFEYDRKKKLISSSYRTYNENGKLLRWLNWGTLVAGYDETVEILYENFYDEKGEVLKSHKMTTRYKSDKQPIEVVEFDGKMRRVREKKFD